MYLFGSLLEIYYRILSYLRQLDLCLVVLLLPLEASL